jgi:hypothetical protein
MLGYCLGGVKREEVQEVLRESGAQRQDIDENSILYWFRTSEVQVGAKIAVPAVAVLMEEREATHQEAFELIPGLKLAFSGTRDFVLDIVTETLELLRGTFKPVLVLRGGASKPVAAKLLDVHKKMIQDHCPVIPVEMRVTGCTLTVTLKWLRDKPSELPKVNAILNGVEVSVASIDIINAEQIIITHDLLSLTTTTRICALRVKYADETMTLEFTLEQ